MKSPLKESPSFKSPSKKSPLNLTKSPSKKLKSPLKEKKTNENLKEITIKNTTSLLYRFESCGFDYNKRNSKDLTYRDIEKVLIFFRNCYSVKKPFIIKYLNFKREL